MKSTHNSQRGQVLIIFVFAIIGLVAITGLAVDGASVYSDRRHAQNAADTAALAAALAKTNWEASNGGTPCGTIDTTTTPRTVPSNGCDAVTKAQDIAGANGYANTNPGTESVDVFSPPHHGYYATCANHDCTPSKYVEVVIKTNVDTWFARVVGIPQTHNTVQAVALADAAHVSSPFPGYAIIGLNPNVSGPHDMSFQAQSNAMQVYINGGGVFANGTAEDVHSTVHIQPPYCATAVDLASGFSCTSPSSPNPALAIQYPASVLDKLPPIPPCTGTAQLGADGKMHEEAGFEGKGSVVNGFDHQYAPGLYCVQNIGNNVTINDNVSGTGVTLYIKDPSFTVQMTANCTQHQIDTNNCGMVSIQAPVADPSVPWTMTYAGMAIFSDVVVANPYGSGTCQQNLQMRGGSATPLVGSVFLPGACINWLGSSGGAARTQLIGWDVYLSGSTDATFNYNASDNYKERYPGQVGIMH